MARFVVSFDVLVCFYLSCVVDRGMPYPFISRSSVVALLTALIIIKGIESLKDWSLLCFDDT